jgi:3-oxoacyl-[acyl-carrier protein] reductase
MGNVVIVTGASGGIGKAIAERLAKDSWEVVLQYGGNQGSADQLARSIEQTGGKAATLYADIANPQSVADLFKRSSEFGTIHGVVHSAGILGLSPIVENDTELFDRVIATNLRGTFLVLAQAAKYVDKGGRIAALSSSVIAKSTPGYGAYIASKAGVEGLVHVLAQEMRGKDICVNAVAPGPVATDFFLQGKTPQQIAQLANMAPLERLGAPGDIAGVVSFLLGPDGGWIHGQVLRANGGFA